MNIKVELDIFSGRPNPTWMLMPEESKELIKLLDSLSEIDDKTNHDDLLGYRGFLLTINPNIKNTAPYDVRVFHGIVIIDSATKKVFKDVHGLEKWLLKHATGKGYGALIDSI